jgi:hypothetical protein
MLNNIKEHTFCYNNKYISVSNKQYKIKFYKNDNTIDFIKSNFNKSRIMEEVFTINSENNLDSMSIINTQTYLYNLLKDPYFNNCHNDFKLLINKYIYYTLELYNKNHFF